MVDASKIEGAWKELAKVQLENVRIGRNPLAPVMERYFQYSEVLYLSYLKGTKKFYLEDGTDQNNPTEIQEDGMDRVLKEMGLEKTDLFVEKVICVFEKKPTDKDPCLLMLAPYDDSMDALIDGGPTDQILSQTPEGSLGMIKSNNWF
jgi:hypothetical protein